MRFFLFKKDLCIANFFCLRRKKLHIRLISRGWSRKLGKFDRRELSLGIYFAGGFRIQIPLKQLNFVSFYVLLQGFPFQSFQVQHKKIVFLMRNALNASEQYSTVFVKNKRVSSSGLSIIKLNYLGNIKRVFIVNALPEVRRLAKNPQISQFLEPV